MTLDILKSNLAFAKQDGDPRPNHAAVRRLSDDQVEYLAKNQTGLLKPVLRCIMRRYRLIEERRQKDQEFLEKIRAFVNANVGRGGAFVDILAHQGKCYYGSRCTKGAIEAAGRELPDITFRVCARGDHDFLAMFRGTPVKQETVEEVALL